MKLSKQQENEVVQVYNAYWDNYIKGDVEAMQLLLDEEYTQVGSAEGEVFLNKKDAVQFLNDTIDQVAGKLEMRNRDTTMEQQGELILIHERCDLFALSDDGWIFYSKFRASTLLKEKKEGWKITHQHSSFPDARAEDGENIAINKMAAENLQLREAVKRRTIELEQKNRDLQIESALEKVRAQAMSMRKPGDLPGICEVLFSALHTLGFDETRNAMINIHDDEKGSFINYDYSDEIGKSINHLFYSIHPVIEKQIKQIRNSGDAFSETFFTGKDLEDWKAFRKKIGEKHDPRIENTDALYYYFYSIGTGSIGISTFHSITEENKNVLKRFRNVFDFAYRRYMDVAEAEAQAREAQIQLALERVRARTMAMQKSEELPEAANLLFQQMQALGMPAWSAGYCIWDENKQGITLWMSSEGVMQPSFHAPLTEDPSFITFLEAYKKGETFFVNEVGGEALVKHYQYMRTLPVVGEILDSIINEGHPLPTFQIFHCAYFSRGFLLFITYEPVPEAHDIFKRFGKVFDQTYTRFLDLQKAEAQAREAQIEAALERVRSQSMAMHKSDELHEVIKVLFEQLINLNFKLDSAQFDLEYKKSDDFEFWTAIPSQPYPFKLHIPYFDHPFLNQKKEAKEKGLDISVADYTFDVKNLYFQHLFKHNPLIPEERKKYILNCPGMAISAVLLKTISLWIGNYNGIAFSCEENAVLKRFALVFEQSYTRFLDLQKAEAQAREAQIEAALERVRSRTMAMQRSDELLDVASILFQQVKALGVPQWNCGFNIWNIGDKEFTYYPGSPDGIISPSPCKIPLTEHPVFRRFDESRKRGDELLIYEKQGEEQTDHYQYMLSLPGVGDLLRSMMNAGFQLPIFQIDHVANFSYGNLIFITFGHFPEMHDVFKRFAKVFEQTYTRFLDLQKAEAQAREAQIEASLERVRSTSLAMHTSQDLSKVVYVVFTELIKLDAQLDRCLILTVNPKTLGITWYLTGKEGLLSNNGFLVEDNPHPSHRAYLEGWKTKRKKWHYLLAGKEKKSCDAYLFSQTQLAQLPDFIKADMAAVESIHLTISSDDFGCLIASSISPLSEAHAGIVDRFTWVFNQAYTRFLDLQKAEAQAREAQIEAALEKVRSRSLAMHRSDELKEVMTVMFEKMTELNVLLGTIAIQIFNEKTKSCDFWVGNDLQNPALVKLPYDEKIMYEDAYMKECWEAKVKGENIINKTDTPEKINKYFDYVFAYNDESVIPPPVRKFIREAKQHAYCLIIEKNSALFADSWNGQLYSEEQINVLKRVAKVFEQAYIRFLDLQKAEAQAREALIETGLERVRSRSMAMHKSSEVMDVAVAVYDELQKLDFKFGAATIIIMDKETGCMEHWLAGFIQKNHVESYPVNNFEHPLHAAQLAAWRNGDKFFSIELSGTALKGYAEEMFTQTGYKNLSGEEKALLLSNDQAIFNLAYMTHGALMWAPSALSEEKAFILQRFAKVFEQTYTRFLDLQKSEAQAREATIEASLEKVRGTAMAMNESKDLSATIVLAFAELKKLGIRPLRFGVGLIDKESHKAQLYSATSSEEGDGLALTGWILFQGHPVLENIYESWIKGRDYFPVLEGEQLKSYYELLSAGLSVPKIPGGQNGEKQYGYFFPLPVSCLYAWALQPFSDADIKTLKRFSSIIELTFRRYLELQKSEASAREAIKQAALDRIRADIASMRTVNDLDRITPLIWKELTILGIPFIRCGVFIMDEPRQLIHTFLSTPDGKAIAAFHLPYDTSGNLSKVLSHWRDNKNYTDHWDETAFTELADILVKQGAITSPEQYLDTLPRGGFYLHFLPFLQGMFYVGNTIRLGDEEIKILQSVADAFATAYARYEDFNKLESAKEQVDKTLVDLRQAQQQLVQSEKMASLGELTAGIAHEIQNPLNFVNNFSEVSNELMDEMNAEIEKGDMEEARAIANDIKQNLEKINHHGKRADAIVKGMLQHSRSNSATKEPTDINKLADEYLRLAYHGLRAKDKSFNATLETDYDESIGNINIIPQDIGRVILNLINNAFYAVAEKKRQAPPPPEGGIKNPQNEYEPAVTVKTFLNPPSGGRGGPGFDQRCRQW